MMGTQGNAVRQPAYGDQVRDERWFRYSVRADRSFALRLEAAAAKAGVSVSAFVQAHFETILQPRAAPPAFDAARFDAVAFGRDHAVPVAAARIWKVLRQRADDKGIVRVTLAEIETATGLNYGSLSKALATLKEAGLVEQLSGAGTKGTQYRVTGG